MTIYISNTIRIEDPNPWITKWVKDNLELPNPEYAKKLRMGKWTGNVPKTIRLYEIDDNVWELPFGTINKVVGYADKPLIHTDFAEHTMIDYGDPVPLYDYQETAVEQMVRARFGILKSAAASGKTQMGIALIKKWKLPALWLCHTADLLNQSKERAERYMDKSLIGTITEGKVNIGKGVTFATIQTMCNVDLDKYRQYWGVIVIDEVHRCAGSPTAVTRYYKVLNALAAKHKYGLTATPDRSDGMIKATFALLGGIAYEVSDDAVADRICKVAIKAISTNTGLSDRCMNGDGTLNYTGLISHLSQDSDRNDLIVKHIVNERNHSCIILSDRLEHLATLRDLLPEDMKAQSVLISGKMTTKRGKAEREAAIEQMRTGEKKYLFATYSLCKEGLDIPRLDRLFMASPIKFYATVVQSIGRIARTAEGKGQPIAYDFVDNIGYCRKAYKERCKHYRKTGAFFV